MNLIYSLSFLLFFQMSFGLHNQAVPVDPARNLSQTMANKDSQRTTTMGKEDVENVILKSTDDGNNWQNIGKSLPDNWQMENGEVDMNVYKTKDYTNNIGLYVRVGNRIYLSKRNASNPNWETAIFPEQMSNMAPSKKGILAYNYAGQILQQANGKSSWSPVYSNFKEGKIRTITETSGGTIFIGTDKGFFKSTNLGNSWKKVLNGGWIPKMVEGNGVLLGTSPKGIIRSTDNGENWALVISEGGAGIDLKTIDGGFAAITFNTTSRTRRIRTSYDGGKTWQAIDAGLPGNVIGIPGLNNGMPSNANIASIIQVGKYLFCGHPSGIYRSADKGKTWERIRCSYPNTVFNLSVSGNVIYAIPKAGGC